MEQEYTRSNIRAARRFLTRLGLQYETLSPSTKKYLLDLQPSAPSNTSAMIMPSSLNETLTTAVTPIKSDLKLVSNKFNNIVNNDLEMRGGNLVLPAEYFGVDSGAYVSASGGGSEGTCQKGLYTSKDLNMFKNAYEKKYMRKLRMSNTARNYALQTLNNYVDTSAIRAVHKSKGKLTKGGMKSEMIR